MILIRADGSGKVGSGHLMRCMTIAERLCEKDNVLFLTSSTESAQMVISRGFQAEVLKYCQTGMEKDVQRAYTAGELSEIAEWISRENPDWVLVDSYQVDAAYLADLSGRARVAYLDDSGVTAYPVDLIINYNVYADRKAYGQLYQNKNTCHLLGADFIPIRSAFTQDSYSVRDEMKNILLLTGGGDYYQLAGKMMHAFGGKPEFGKYQFHLICGYYNNQADKLRKDAKQYGNFEIYENVPDIWNLMHKCDLAISAGGTTVYELCAIGLPFLGYSFADNQKPVLTYMHENCIAPNCGDYREKQAELFEAMAKHITEYEDAQLRKSVSARLKELVDGQGAGRIAEKLLA